MKRGDIVTVATGGGFGSKPRPALILQDDQFHQLSTVVVVLFGSGVDAAPLSRPIFEPDAVNGLRVTSQLMTNTIVTARRSDIGKIIGRLSTDDLRRAERAVLVMLGFA